MTEKAQERVDRLLVALDRGGRSALDELTPYLYDELQEVARRIRRRWRGNHTLNTTALLHEAYLKLVEQGRLSVENRTHFLALAARAMRHILINYARDRAALKRGGGQTPMPLDETRLTPGDVDLSPTRLERLILLHDALRSLEEIDPRQGRVVECRFFGGMTVGETAVAVGVSERTVKRDWALAQAWLAREMESGGA